MPETGKPRRRNPKGRKPGLSKVEKAERDARMTKRLNLMRINKVARSLGLVK